MEKKEPVMSEATKAALAVLTAADKPLSLEEISDKAGIEVKTGNLSSLIKRQVIVSTEQIRVCPTCGHKTKYHVYSIKAAE